MGSGIWHQEPGGRVFWVVCDLVMSKGQERRHQVPTVLVLDGKEAMLMEQGKQLYVVDMR